mgnify:FL=1
MVAVSLKKKTGGSQATTKKIYIGKGVKYFPKSKVGEFKLESGTLSVDTDIMITGSTTGIILTKVQELRMDDLPVTTVKKGDVFSMPIAEKIKPSDKLYKIIND